MFNLILACIFLVLWAAGVGDRPGYWLTLTWFNLAVFAVLHIADAIRSRR